MAKKASSVIARKLLTGSGWSMAWRAIGCLSASASRSHGPSNIQKVTKTPTARNANSLTIDFGGDREHQAVLVLGRVGVAGAEQNREDRHRERDDEREVADDRHRGPPLAPITVSSEEATAFSCSAM